MSNIVKTNMEVLAEEIETAIHAALDLTSNTLTVGEIIGALETTKLMFFHKYKDAQDDEEDDYQEETWQA